MVRAVDKAGAMLTRSSAL